MATREESPAATPEDPREVFWAAIRDGYSYEQATLKEHRAHAALAVPVEAPA